MKTVRELRDAVLAAGGTLDIGQGITMTYHESDGDRSDLDIKHNMSLIGWISGNRDNDAILELSIAGTEVFNHYAALGILGRFIGVLSEQAITTVRVEPVESITEHRLGGMVEAYEKLLIGRGVTITN